MRKYIYILLSIFTFSCTSKVPVDLIVYNAKVYTCDSSFNIAEAFAVKDGKFVAIGSNDSILDHFSSIAKVDAQSKAVFPGLIDPHAHFWGYATDLAKCQLHDAKSWPQAITMMRQYASANPSGWLLARAWDQNKWADKQWPNRTLLDQAFPDRPVFAMRIDGHAVVANKVALDLAGITANTKVKGGEIVVLNGQTTGLLIDNAVDLLKKAIPAYSEAYQINALKQAQDKCFAVGLTSVADAGLPYHTVRLLDSLAQLDALNIRLYVMLEPSKANLEQYIAKGPYQTDNITIGALKIYADGALGSRGAYMLYPYNDDLTTRGFLLTDSSTIDSLARFCYSHGFQVNTHCIGDGANRMVLHLYGNILKGPNDRRWRIEHAQLVHENDMSLFGQYNIVPSMQPVHATSDMNWAYDRVGDRLRYGYALKRLKDQNGFIPLGSDFPVEDINPLQGFLAAVYRRNSLQEPKEGFQFSDALSKKEALWGTTLWAAYANKEDKLKGSIQPGKLADFVLFSDDFYKAAPEKILNCKPLATWVGGKQVYGKPLR